MLLFREKNIDIVVFLCYFLVQTVFGRIFRIVAPKTAGERKLVKSGLWTDICQEEAVTLPAEEE